MRRGNEAPSLMEKIRRNVHARIFATRAADSEAESPRADIRQLNIAAEPGGDTGERDARDAGEDTKGIEATPEERLSTFSTREKWHMSLCLCIVLVVLIGILAVAMT